MILPGSLRSGGQVRVLDQSDNVLVVEFTPDTDFEGAASFDFTVDDREGHNLAGAVTVNVLPPSNRPPVPMDITVTAEAGVPYLLRLPDYVSDEDPDGSALALVLRDDSSGGQHHARSAECCR